MNAKAEAGAVGLDKAKLAASVVLLVGGIFGFYHFAAQPLFLRVLSLLVIAGVLQPVNGAVFVLDGVLIGAGDMRWLAVAMAISLTGFVPAVWAVLATDAGIEWLWAALGWFMLLRLATLALRWKGPHWAIPGAER